jgi:hypothetical protein
VLNSSPGQAVGTVEIVGQHQPSDKYLYQLRACACTPVQRLSVSFKLSCLRPLSKHAKSRSRALSTVYFQGIFTAIVYIVHVATFGQVILDETMFYLKRTVVDYTSIIDTYRVVQIKYKYSVSYSTRIIVSIMYTEE